MLAPTVGLLVLGSTLSVAQDKDSAESSDDSYVGAWNCIVYGSRMSVDERVLLRFLPDRATQIARVRDEQPIPWTYMSHWRRSGNKLIFTDLSRGRTFQADLSRDSLGGEWSTPTLTGGWRCAGLAQPLTEWTTEDGQDVVAPPAVALPTLESLVTGAPAYPNAAIRRAIEGEVLICYEVAPDGTIRDPEVVKISNEIFRAPSLAAVAHSRYKAWSDDPDVPGRPACRSFTYALKRVN